MRAVRISEANILELEPALKAIRIDRAAFFYRVVCVKDLEKSFGVGKGFVNLVINSMKLPDRRRDVVEQQDMVHYRPDRHLLIEHEIRRENDDQNDTDLF